jgi:hypothetical protein
MGQEFGVAGIGIRANGPSHTPAEIGRPTASPASTPDS